MMRRGLLTIGLVSFMACGGSGEEHPVGGAGGVGGTGGGGGPEVATLEVAPASLVVGIGEEEPIEVVARDAAGEALEVRLYFVSVDPEVALVTGAGVVVGRAKGQTRIEVEGGGQRAVVAVTVEGEPAHLEIPGSLTLPVGEGRALEIVLADEDGVALDPSRLSWSSTDPDVARFRAGEVVATGWGEALLTASAGELEASLEVRTLLRFAEIGLGDAHSCARTPTREVYCWGRGDQGELGFDSADDVVAAPMAPVGEGARFTALAVGAHHACALDAAGAAHCWGRNDQSQLGENRAVSSAHPVEIEGLPPLEAIVARGAQTCGLDASGAVHCWGGPAVPAEATEGHDFVEVAAGRAHVCARTGDGAAYCWGENGSGQLGAQDLEAGAAPRLVGGLPPLQALASGEDHVCGIAEDDAAVYCWGANLHGELGQGLVSEREVPDRAISIFPFRSLGMGGGLSCAISDGAGAYCWGANDLQQSGSGREEAILSEPEKVVAGSWTFEAIAAGASHVCALTDNGEAYCWGDTASGKLGVPSCGEGTLCPTPQLVIGQR